MKQNGGMTGRSCRRVDNLKERVERRGDEAVAKGGTTLAGCDWPMSRMVANHRADRRVPP